MAKCIYRAAGSAKGKEILKLPIWNLKPRGSSNAVASPRSFISPGQFGSAYRWALPDTRQSVIVVIAGNFHIPPVTINFNYPEKVSAVMLVDANKFAHLSSLTDSFKTA